MVIYYDIYILNKYIIEHIYRIIYSIYTIYSKYLIVSNTLKEEYFFQHSQLFLIKFIYEITYHLIYICILEI